MGLRLVSEKVKSPILVNATKILSSRCIWLTSWVIIGATLARGEKEGEEGKGGMERGKERERDWLVGL